MTGKKLEPSAAQDKFAETFKIAALPKLKAAKKLVANKEYVEASGRRFILAYPFTQNPIKLLRHFMGITQTEAAAILEITQAALSAMERGKLESPTLVSHMFEIAATFGFEVAITNAPSSFSRREATPEQQAAWEAELSPQAKFENGWSYFGSGTPTYTHSGSMTIPEPDMLFKSFEDYQQHLMMIPFKKDKKGRPGQFCTPELGEHTYTESNIRLTAYPNGKWGREVCLECLMIKSRQESEEILARIEVERMLHENQQKSDFGRQPENFLEEDE